MTLNAVRVIASDPPMPAGTYTAASVAGHLTDGTYSWLDVPDGEDARELDGWLDVWRVEIRTERRDGVVRYFARGK